VSRNINSIPSGENPSLADIRHNSVSNDNTCPLPYLAIFNYQNGLDINSFLSGGDVPVGLSLAFRAVGCASGDESTLPRFSRAKVETAMKVALSHQFQCQ